MKIPVKYKAKVRFRSDLFTLLTEACELEHGLACSYLYSAFSLKQNVDEGITPAQQQHIRKWASQMFFIASQEMLHLAQVWNLLKAIGGTPYYFRPNFPQGSKYYPFHLPLKLEPFSMEALQRFLFYELPSGFKDPDGKILSEKDYARKQFGFFSEDNYTYKTVGELYTLILDGFKSIDQKELFIGNPDLQLGPDEIDFKEIIKVTDSKSAEKAINMIMDQGEGTATDREDCHFGIFKKIRDDYKSFLSTSPDFRPARNTVSNPVVFDKGNNGTEGGELIINKSTRDLADLFDDVYNLMLQALQYCFANTQNIKPFNKAISGIAIQMMVRVIKPLGELLTKLPAFNDPDFKTAGPSFSMARHVTLVDDNKIAATVIYERASEILFRFKNMKLSAFSESLLITKHFEDIADQLKKLK